VGEDLAEDLRVLVRQTPRVDVIAAELVALQVGGAHTGDAQLVELVVPAHAGERDPVVDLAATGDALAGVVGLVLHRLLGRHPERHRHRGCASAAMAAKRAASSSSATRWKPSVVIVATVG
jgi:hypothetical protein